MGRRFIYSVPAFVLAVGAWRHRWVSDDGFINLRIARMLLHGHGPVVNIGERVEAATSPLWVAVLAVGDILLPLRLEWVAVILGIALSVAGVLLVTYAATRLWGDGVPIGALAFVAIPVVWDYATSGLEVGLSFFWIGACAAVLARSTDRDISGWTAVLIGIGPLIRPDFAVISATLFITIAIGWRPPHLVRLAAYALALPLAAQVLRMGYYGALVPNTYFAKEGGRAWWSQGWAYLNDFVTTYWLWVPLLALAAVVILARAVPQSRPARAVVIGLPVAGILHALSVVRFGGDFMHGRLLLPSLLLIITPVAVVPITKRTIPLVAVIASWAVLCALTFRAGLPLPLPGIADVREFTVQLNRNQHPVDVDSHHPAHAKHGVLVVYALGAASYAASDDTYIIDVLGLAEPFVARFQLNSRGDRPGHEKVMPPDWLQARLDELGITDKYPSPPTVFTDDHAPTLLTMHRDVNAARAALKCDTLYGRASRPLTPRRFLANLHDAVTTFSDRVPVDADAARAQLCGT